MSMYDEGEDIEDLYLKINKILKKHPQEKINMISIDEPGKVTRYSKDPNKAREKKRAVWLES